MSLPRACSSGSDQTGGLELLHLLKDLTLRSHLELVDRLSADEKLFEDDRRQDRSVDGLGLLLGGLGAGHDRLHLERHQGEQAVSSEVAEVVVATLVDLVDRERLGAEIRERRIHTQERIDGFHELVVGNAHDERAVNNSVLGHEVSNQGWGTKRTTIFIIA